MSLKKSAYADTGFWGSLGSFFFRPFLPAAATAAARAVTEASVAGLPPPLRRGGGARGGGGGGRWEGPEEEEAEERDMGESTRTLFRAQSGGGRGKEDKHKINHHGRQRQSAHTCSSLAPK